jgi:hypothetical protein
MRLHEAIQMRHLRKSRNIVDRLRNRVNTQLETVFLLHELIINNVLAVFAIPILSEFNYSFRLLAGFHNPEEGTA